MALSTRKKNQIIADHKTGKFSSISALANHYKVDRKTVKKLTDGISAVHADIVEAGAVYENAKKSLKNPVEIKAIEKAVEEQTIADEIEGIIFDGTMDNMKGVAKEVKLDGMEMSDRKLAQDTFDRGLITVGKANRHAPKTDINVAQQTNTVIEAKEPEY